MTKEDLRYEMHALFPSSVLRFNINRSFTEEEISVIRNQKNNDNLGNTTSLDTYIFSNNEELRDIKQFCMDCVEIYFRKVICAKPEAEIYMTQSWCNYTTPGQFHHKHAHQNSLISGVLYVDADKEKDKITFYQRSQYQQILLDASEFNPFNSTSWWLPVGTGDLLLFHSSLEHSVERTVSDKTRISISFNTFVKGSMGTEKTLTQLILK